jgi:hypothetical protein
MQSMLLLHKRQKRVKFNRAAVHSGGTYATSAHHTLVFSYHQHTPTTSPASQIQGGQHADQQRWL